MLFGSKPPPLGALLSPVPPPADAGGLLAPAPALLAGDWVEPELLHAPAISTIAAAAAVRRRICTSSGALSAA
jgi:hypothetical protein